MKAFFGIYWTFPVRWVGFTHFESVEQAARISRTIRYQRDVIRREVAARKGDLAAEAAFMEHAPDRGTPELADEIARAIRKAILACLQAAPDMKPSALAEHLNATGLRTHTGKLWNPDNLRKFMSR